MWVSLSVIGVLILVFIGVGIYEVVTPGHQFPASERTAFVNGCEQNGGNSAFCGCALKYLEKHVSEVQFEQIASDKATSNAEVNQAAQACAGLFGNSGSAGG